MKAVRIRKTLCLMLSCALMASCLSSCAALKPAATTAAPSVTSESAKDEIPQELLNVEEQIKKLTNIEGNIWINEDKKYEDLMKKLKSQVKDNVAIKGSLIIATDEDIIVASGARLKDREGNDVTPYTTYEIGSLTKSMTAVCVMKLVEDGKIKLDDTLGDYFSEYSSAASYGEVSKITVKNLLHMRSGLLDFMNDPSGFWGEEVGVLLRVKGVLTEERFNSFFGKYGSKITEQAFTCKPGAEQGTKFDYCNTNYYLLSVIIEKVTGKTYAEFMEETIFKPCNMTSTSAMKFGDVQASIKKNAWYFSPESAKGCGDVHSSVVDILKYDRALFGGHLLNEESMKELLTPVDGYACGWEQTGTLIQHGGTTAGFSTFDGAFEKDGKKLYVIMCANLGEECVMTLIVPVAGLTM